MIHANGPQPMRLEAYAQFERRRLNIADVRLRSYVNAVSQVAWNKCEVLLYVWSMKRIGP